MTATALLILAALAGAPLFAVIAASAMLGFSQDEVDLSVVAIEIYRLAEMPVLLAIPLFTFAGYLLGESQAPGRLVRLTHALLGWLSGGLAIVSLAACALIRAQPAPLTIFVAALVSAAVAAALARWRAGRSVPLEKLTGAGGRGQSRLLSS